MSCVLECCCGGAEEINFFSNLSSLFSLSSFFFSLHRKVQLFRVLRAFLSVFFLQFFYRAQYSILLRWGNWVVSHRAQQNCEVKLRVCLCDDDDDDDEKSRSRNEINVDISMIRFRVKCHSLSLSTLNIHTHMMRCCQNAKVEYRWLLPVQLRLGHLFVVQFNLIRKLLVFHWVSKLLAV